MEYLKALIIDDEIDICLLLAGMLKGMGYESICACSISDGYARYMEENTPLVFIDLSLPDGSGYALIEPIKEASPEAKIVIISAYDSHQDRKKALSLGANYFISKPLNRKLLEDVMKEVETNHAA